MAVARTFTKFPRHGTSVLDLLALTRTGWERVTGVVGDTVTLTNQPSQPVRVYLNGRLLDPDSTPAEYVLEDRTVTLARAIVATDVVMIDHFYRTQ